MTLATPNSAVSPQEAAQELLKRRAARQSLPAFIDYLCLGYQFAAHHKLLMAELEAVERGDTPRLMVFMPPGSAKSTYSSVLFPPWFMGRNPLLSVLGVSNTTELAQHFSRRARNLVAGPEYRAIFAAGVSEDAAAAGSWETTAGGQFFAAGMGSAIAGRRADLGLIDDPIKTREEADSDLIRQKQWDWYVNDFLTRLKPNARQILIQCMSGDTQVMMANGTSTALRDIRAGDEVATFNGQGLVGSKVLNWANQGPDCVFTIRMKSGITVVANERHPFLVMRDGETAWLKLKSLKVGDNLLMARNIGVSGEASSAHISDATDKQKPKAIACLTTIKPNGQAGIATHPTIHKLTDKPTSSIVTDSASSNIAKCLTPKEGNARYAENYQARMSAHTGAENSALTTTMLPEKCEDFCVTTATLQSDTVRQSAYSCSPLNTYEITYDEIADISPSGQEDVFDIQVADTENFIANGLISHNTRWHEDDLGGRILEREANKWRVIKLPMLAVQNDALGRQVGERLWPEWFTQDMIETARMDVRAWNALYQQDPVPDEGAYFKKSNFSEYDSYPTGLHVYGASDYAVTDGGGDFTEHGIFGVDASGNVFVLDWWRAQASADVWIEAQCDLIRQWQPMVWFGEAGPIRRAIEPFLVKRMSDRAAYCRLEWMASIADKEIRARSIQALASIKTLAMPKNEPWKPEVMKQLLQFPAGKHDDAVDVFSLIGRGLEFIKPVRRKAPQQPTVELGHWMG